MLDSNTIENIKVNLDELSNNRTDLLFTAITGSTCRGLNRPDSDVDMRSVFVPNRKGGNSIVKLPETYTLTGDNSLESIKHWCSGLIRCTPDATELLFADDIVYNQQYTDIINSDLFTEIYSCLPKGNLAYMYSKLPSSFHIHYAKGGKPKDLIRAIYFSLLSLHFYLAKKSKPPCHYRPLLLSLEEVISPDDIGKLSNLISYYLETGEISTDEYELKAVEDLMTKVKFINNVTKPSIYISGVFGSSETQPQINQLKDFLEHDVVGALNKKIYVGECNG
jgi:hypothetical protein